jgi:hypothetical protein
VPDELVIAVSNERAVNIYRQVVDRNVSLVGLDLCGFHSDSHLGWNDIPNLRGNELLSALSGVEALPAVSRRSTQTNGSAAKYSSIGQGFDLAKIRGPDFHPG